MAVPHRKRIEKRDRVAQRHVGRIIYTNPDLVYGATSCQRLFRRHGKLRQRILYCSQFMRSLFLAMGRRMVVSQPYAMVCQIQRHPYFFSVMCHCLYRFIVAGHATYLQRVLLYSFFSHTQHVYFLELRSKWHPEWHGSLLVHLGNDVCQPSTCNDRVMRVGSRNPQIHLSDGWSRHTDLVHQKQLLVSGRMGGMCRRIVCRRRTYPSIFGGNKSNGGRQPLFRLSDR